MFETLKGFILATYMVVAGWFGIGAVPDVLPAESEINRVSENDSYTFYTQSVYQNEELGFRVNMPESWTRYAVRVEKKNEGAIVWFGLPLETNQITQWLEGPEKESGVIDIAGVLVTTTSDFDSLNGECDPAVDEMCFPPSILFENKEYVFSMINPRPHVDWDFCNEETSQVEQYVCSVWGRGSNQIKAGFSAIVSDSEARVKLYDLQGNETVYEKDQYNLYAWGDKVDLSWLSESGLSLNLESFEVINASYSKDSQRVYSGLGQKFSDVVEGADPITFRLEYPYIGRDHKNIWIMDAFASIVIGADASTFEQVPNSFSSDSGRGYYRDKNRVYKYVPEHMFASAIPVIGADPATFKIVTGNNEYDAEDKNHKYKNGEVLTQKMQLSYIEDGSLSPYYKDSESVYFEDTKIIGADFDTFQALSAKLAAGGNDNEWAKDKNNVYDFGEVVLNADPATFTTVYQGVMKDKNRVYLYGGDSHLPYSPVYGVDAPSFVHVGYGFFKDKNYAYDREYNKLLGVDPNTFIAVGIWYFKDKDNVYYAGAQGDVKLENANPDTFVYDEKNNVGKDKNYVWYVGRLVSGADPATIMRLNDWWLIDKNNVYYEGDLNHRSALEKVEPTQFEPLLFNGGPTIYGIEKTKIVCPFEDEYIDVDSKEFKVIGEFSAQAGSKFFEACKEYGPKNP